MSNKNEVKLVKLKYRLSGDVNVLTKEFDTRESAITWAKAQGNILILEVETSGAEMFKRIFG